MKKVLNPEYIEVAWALEHEPPYESYCNACGFVTKRDTYNGSCPYHQKVLSDGTLLWEEFPNE
jgi:hypothetical protein